MLGKHEKYVANINRGNKGKMSLGESRREVESAASESRDVGS
jgi:hypothetical protein